jgi:hypothetical protein
MIIETTELTILDETTNRDEAHELLALSADDLDLVGGGAQIGVNL